MNNHVVFDSRLLIKMNRTWQDAASQASSQDSMLPPIKLSAHGDVTNFKDFVTLIKGNLSEAIYLQNLSHYLWDDTDIVKAAYGDSEATVNEEDEMLVDGMRDDMARKVHLNIFREMIPGWSDLLDELDSKDIPYGILMNTDHMIVDNKLDIYVHYSAQAKSLHPSKNMFTSYGSGSWLASIGNPKQHLYFDTTDAHVQLANQQENWQGFLIPGVDAPKEVRDILVKEIYLDKVPVYSAYNDI